MFKSAAAIGILASGSATFDQVGAVQLVADEKNAHKLYDVDDDQDIEEDNTLIETRKQLDMVEDQLNQMKMETEAHIEIAEEGGHKHKSKSGKKHHKKSKHIKNKKAKAHKKHTKKHQDADDTEEAEETPATADMSESAGSSSAYGGISADDEQFQYKKPAHQGHRKRGHSGHKKVRKASHSSHKKQQEDDPFSGFEESLTRHHKGKVSHAQRKKSHKHHQLAQSVPACTSLGCATESAHKPAADSWPKDYPVANWGSDHDMANTAAHAAAAEGKLGAWNPKQDEDGNWVVPTAEPEFRLAGVKTDVRLNSKSDPICSSAGCTQYEHPSKELGYKLDYPVPNFGADHDIVMSKKNAAQAEAALGHTFTPTQDEDGEWEVPTETAEFKLAGVKSDVHLGKKKVKAGKKEQANGSDPSCTSAGWCGESLWPAQKAKKEHSVLRLDTDIGANRQPSLERSAHNEARKLRLTPDPHPTTPEPKADPHSPYYVDPEVPYATAQEAQSQGGQAQEGQAQDASGPIQEAQAHAQIKSTHKDTEDPPRAKVSPEAAEPPAVEDENSCEKRATGGQSELVSAEEMKKCNEWKEIKKWFGFCQQQALAVMDQKEGESLEAFEKRMKSGQTQQVSEEQWKKCHETFQTKSRALMQKDGDKKDEKKDQSVKPNDKKDPDDPECIARLHGGKSSQVTDDQWKNCHSNMQKDRKDPDDPQCVKRLKGGKSSTVTDDQWKDCHVDAQVKSESLSQNKKDKKDPDDPQCIKRLKGGKSSTVTDDQWKDCHVDAQVKSESLSQNKKDKRDPDDPQCVKRLKGGKSSQVTDDQWKDCHADAQVKSESLSQNKNDKRDPDDPQCVKRLKGGKSSQVTDDQWKDCHADAQVKSESLSQNKKDKKDPDDPQCIARLKGGKSSRVTDDQWKDCHADAQVKSESLTQKHDSKDDLKLNNPKDKKSDPACSSAGWCGQPWPHYMKDEREIVEYKTGLPLDKDIRDTQSHMADQEAVHGTWTMDKEPKNYRGQKNTNKPEPKTTQQKPEQKKEAKTEEKTIKEKTKLQTTVDLRSDPAFNSDDGYETRYMNPSDKEKIIQYPHDLAYDSDVIATQAHIKGSEGTLGHKFDPVPYLNVQQKYESDETQQGQESQAPADQEPQSMAQQSSSQKSAVKTEAKAKVKAQTKAEKMSSFVQMRKKMMSNWGTK